MLWESVAWTTIRRPSRWSQKARLPASNVCHTPGTGMTGYQKSRHAQLFSTYAWDLGDLYTTGEVTLVPDPGDINRDGRVDATDLSLVRYYFGTSDGGDGNDDGMTDATDLALVRSNFGQTAATPEPVAIGLITAGVMVLRRRRN